MDQPNSTIAPAGLFSLVRGRPSAGFAEHPLDVKCVDRNEQDDRKGGGQQYTDGTEQKAKD